MSRNYKCVIVNLEGVVFDPSLIYEKLLPQQLSHLGIDILLSDIDEYWGLRPKDFWKSISQDFHLNLKIDELVAQSEIEIMAQLRQSQINPISGFVEFAAAVKSMKKKLALVSSAPRKRTEYILDQIGLTDIFDVSVCEDEVFQGKPKPEIFLRAARGCMAAPLECMVIEDSRVGALGAIEADMTVVGLKAIEQNFQDLSDCDDVFLEFSELKI